jgi:transposase-like protein
MSRRPSATPRAEPLSCPYCGLEELLPEERESTWRCESCTRVFLLQLLEVGR